MNYDEVEEILGASPREELLEAIKNNDLEKYTLKQLKEGMLQGDGGGGTLYHWAAQHGHLGRIPQELLTKKNLLQTNKYHQTCLHWAAYGGHLDQIPKELLTEKNLLKPDVCGHTCVHWAAFNGQLGGIPKELLTKENLLQGDKQHKNCLYWAAERGTLHQIPLLSHQTFLALKTHFETQNYSKHEDKIRAFLEKQLQELRKKTLEKSLRSCDHPDL